MNGERAPGAPPNRPLKPMTRALLTLAAVVSVAAALTASAAVAGDVARANAPGLASLISR
jgi:hypothetical protein